MHADRYAPPNSPVLPPDTPPQPPAGGLHLVAELGRVVANAMAHFDALPGARRPDRGGGISGAAQRDVARKSGNVALFRVLGLLAGIAVLTLLKPSFAVTAGICGAVLVVTVAVIVHGHRRAGAAARESVDRMPEALRAVAQEVVALRQSLPPSHGQLAEALETIEARMARIFNGPDAALATALLKLAGKVFGYEGFERLCRESAGVAAPLAAVKERIAQALQARTAATAP